VPYNALCLIPASDHVALDLAAYTVGSYSRSPSAISTLNIVHGSNS
jgi:hypothetical protein